MVAFWSRKVRPTDMKRPTVSVWLLCEFLAYLLAAAGSKGEHMENYQDHGPGSACLRQVSVCQVHGLADFPKAVSTHEEIVSGSILLAEVRSRKQSCLG